MLSEDLMRAAFAVLAAKNNIVPSNTNFAIFVLGAAWGRESTSLHPVTFDGAEIERVRALAAGVSPASYSIAPTLFDEPVNYKLVFRPSERYAFRGLEHTQDDVPQPRMTRSVALDPEKPGMPAREAYGVFRLVWSDSTEFHYEMVGINAPLPEGHSVLAWDSANRSAQDSPQLGDGHA